MVKGDDLKNFRISGASLIPAGKEDKWVRKVVGALAAR
jgi:hypothetical protein